MSSYTQNANYGRIQTSGVPFLGTGKTFIVGDSSTANLSMIQEMFPVDVDGQPRVHATIDAAVGFCTASAGDVIYVLPGHTEALTAAGSLDLDVQGITVIGLGKGGDRPTITYGTTANADVDIDAASITVENIIFDMTGIDAVVAGIDVNSSDFTLRNCRVLMGDSDGQAVVGVLSDTNVDRVVVEDCDFYGDTIAGPATAIRLIGGVEHIIRRNNIHGSFSAACLSLITTAPLRVLIEDNVLMNQVASGTAAITGIAAMTGCARFNHMFMTTNQGGWFTTPGSFASFENYGVNVLGESGTLEVTGGVSTT